MKDLRDIRTYKTILVDGANLAARNYHGVRLTWDGKPTGMLYGVVRFIALMRSLYKTAQIIFLWEGGSSKRKQIDPLYKANRVRTSDGTFGMCLEESKKAVEWMGCDQLWHVGLEADDLAAWYVNGTLEDVDILLVSNDEDWFQCLGPHVDIYRQEQIETYADIKSRLGYPPERIGLWKILTGDKSDNIPGIPRMLKAAARTLVDNCATYQEFRDFSLALENQKWAAWDNSIAVLWDSVIERNANLILFHPEWVLPEKLSWTMGNANKVALRELLDDNGMAQMIMKMEAMGYV